MKRRRTLKHRHRVLFLTCLLSVITYLDRVCVSVAGPRIQHALDLTSAQWGWVGTIFVVSYGLFEIPSGYQGDRIGARTVLSRIVLWWSAFTAVTGLAWNYLSLMVTRFLFGAGEAGAYPNMCVTLSRWFPRAEQARAMGMTLMAAEVGAALTPLLVIPIQKHFGWRASFFVLGLIGVLWVAAWRRWYHDQPEDSPRISSGELAEIGFATEDRGQSLPWGIFLGSANLWAIVLAGFAFRYGFYFFQFWMHTYLVKGRGFTETALLLTTWIYAGGALTNVLGGWVSDALVGKLGLKWARRAVPFAGLIMSALCLALTTVVSGIHPVLAMLTLSYCGINFAQATCWTVCMDVGTRFSGAVSGARNTAANGGAMISSAAFGYMVRNSGSYDHALLPIAGMLALSAVFCLRIDASEQLFPSVSKAVAARSS